MDAETKRFLRNRKLQTILPWAGLIGIIVLTFSVIFGGIPLFLTEVGFIANIYYWIDEYNWVSERIVFSSEHLIDEAPNKNHLDRDECFGIFNHDLLGFSQIPANVQFYFRNRLN